MQSPTFHPTTPLTQPRTRSRPSLLSLSLTLLLTLQPTLADTISSVLSSNNLTSVSYTFSVPGTTLNSADTSNWVVGEWDVDGKIDFGSADIVFSPDPSTSISTLVRRADSSASSTSTSIKSKSSSSKTTTSSSSSDTNSASATTTTTYPASTSLGGDPPVLRVNYPQGSYSKRTGGTQFYSVPSEVGGMERMLLAYDIWFPAGYAWNMGGKLPGLRGGPDIHGCSGGNETNGSGCFSTRLMWRGNGAGEVYAYIPTSQKNFCSESNVICNPDYGTSLSRGSFSFVTGQWQTIWLMVILNELGTANGVVQLWYNGVQALSFTNLELRSTKTNIDSVGGLFFSTFFGGDDSSWATPTSQYTYYRNITLYGGQGASTLAGNAVTGGAGRGVVVGSPWLWGSALVVVVVTGFFGVFA